MFHCQKMKKIETSSNTLVLCCPGDSERRVYFPKDVIVRVRGYSKNLSNGPHHAKARSDASPKHKLPIF